MIPILESNKVNCFNTTNTGMPAYNSMLCNKLGDDNISPAEYYRFEKGLEGHIMYLTARDYMKGCAKYAHHTSVENEYLSVNDMKVDRYASNIESGMIYDMPVLNVAEHQQEGRHRMLAMAKVYGEDAIAPVLIVRKTECTEYEIKNYILKKWGDRYFDRFYEYILKCLGKR